jgi:hypothetical protein
MNPKRDPNSKAIINTDAEALNKYKLERAYYRKIDSMQKDLIEIKRSITTIFERIEKLESK